MNQYILRMASMKGLDGARKKIVTQIAGYMAIMGIDLDTTSSEVDGADIVLRSTCSLRLPGVLGVTPVKILDTLAVGTDFARLTLADNQMTQELNNTERNIVQAGNFICAIAAAGVSLDSQLVNASFIDTEGSRLYFGIASQSAQEGIYDTPFSTAEAFTNFGFLDGTLNGISNSNPATTGPGGVVVAPLPLTPTASSPNLRPGQRTNTAMLGRRS